MLTSSFKQWGLDYSTCLYFIKNLSVSLSSYSHAKTHHSQIDFICNLLNANATPDVFSLSFLHLQRFFREYCFQLKPLLDIWIAELDLQEVYSAFHTHFSDVTKLSMQDTTDVIPFLASLRKTMEKAAASKAKQTLQSIQKEKQTLFGGYFARRLQSLQNKEFFSIPELHELDMIYNTLQKHNRDYQELYSVRLFLWFHVDA